MPSSTLPRRRWLGWLLCTSAFVLSCVSPTIPLPPPEEPDTIQRSKADPNLWTISGSCKPGALVTVFNEDTGRGVVVEDAEQTGRYVVELRATECDFAFVSQVQGDDASSRTGFVIQEVQHGTPVDGSKCK